MSQERRVQKATPVFLVKRRALEPRDPQERRVSEESQESELRATREREDRKVCRERMASTA